MSTDSYVYIILYDIPHSEGHKPYLLFRRHLKKLRGMMLQESVYLIYVKNKAEATRIKNELVLVAPSGSNIRGLLITSQLFDSLDVISGEVLTVEKILSKKVKVIEL